MAIAEVHQGEDITAAKQNEIIGAVNSNTQFMDGEVVWGNGFAMSYPGYPPGGADYPEQYHAPWLVDENNLSIYRPLVKVGMVQYEAPQPELSAVPEVSGDWYVQVSREMLSGNEQQESSIVVVPEDEVDESAYVALKVFSIYRGEDNESGSTGEPHGPYTVKYWDTSPTFAGVEPSTQPEVKLDLSSTNWGILSSTDPEAETTAVVQNWNYQEPLSDDLLEMNTLSDALSCRLLARPEEGGTLKYVSLSGILSALSSEISSGGGGDCSCEMSAIATQFDKDWSGSQQQYWENAKVGQFTDCQGNETMLYAPNHIQLSCNMYPYYTNMGNQFTFTNGVSSNIEITPDGTTLRFQCFYM